MAAYSINYSLTGSSMQLQHCNQVKLPGTCVDFILFPPCLDPTAAPPPPLPLTSRNFFPASLNVDLQTTCPFSSEGMHPGWVTMPQAEGQRERTLGVGTRHWEWEQGIGSGTRHWKREWDTGSGRHRILETDYIWYLLINIKQTALQHQ